MSKAMKRHGIRAVVLLMAVLTVVAAFPGTASAAQEDNYHDPADKWLTASDRTNELDVNSIVSTETFLCSQCGQYTAFLVFRTPEYTTDGRTALSRDVYFSDGTMKDGVTVGTILDGTPGVDAYYTGAHWTKAVCQTCGTMNTNRGLKNYSYAKNLYWLYDCSTEFMETLDDVVTYTYTDNTYHTKTTKSGTYCCFCYGTYKEENSELEHHTMTRVVTPQPGNHRFAVKDSCSLCGYEKITYTAAKSVIADYYGTADGQPHTITVTDLSETGVSVQIRYGNSADSCTFTSAPNYTDAGQYTVYYKITYSCGGSEIEENGAAYVWLREESSAAGDGECSCGCGGKDCGCDGDCGGDCCDEDGCGGTHSFVLLEEVGATCRQLGYDRYLCTGCGVVEKRDYTAALGHAWQGVVVRESSCESTGKLMEICSRCGEVKVTETPKGEHEYSTYTVEAACTSSGYSVQECGICGGRKITGITEARGHRYSAYTVPATCETEGRTVNVCVDCGHSIMSGHITAAGHNWDGGTTVTAASCTAQGVTEYGCTKCGITRLQTISASGHTAGEDATCVNPQTCTDCGAVLKNAAGHDIHSKTTSPTCTEMGYTTYDCVNCPLNYKSDYTSSLGHSWSKGKTIISNCGGNVTEYSCERCDVSKLETEVSAGHRAGDAATCVNPQTCTDCGAILKNAAGHDIQSKTTPPTCTEMGYTTYDCADCTLNYKSDYLPSLGHDWEQTVITEAACISQGITEHSCVRCSESYLETIPSTGHTHGADATCTTPQVCTDCDAVIKPALKHIYRTEVTAPTCTEMGYITYSCVRCDREYKNDYTAPRGHDYESKITAPSCLEDGYTTFTCRYCGDDCTTDRTEALGHEWDEGRKVADSTCSGDGVAEYRCMRCDAARLESKSAEGHTPGTAATCTAPQLCTVCGVVLENAAGHNIQSKTTSSDCTEMGYTTYDCLNCEFEYNSDYTKPLGHDYTAETTEAGCLTEGYTTYTCSRCGDSYVSDHADELGHRWNGGGIIANPACTGEGVKEYRCEVCNESRLETIASTGHVHGEPATCTDAQLCVVCGGVIQPAFKHDIEVTVTEAACLEPGYTTHACSRCELEYVSDHVEPLGHEWDEGRQVTNSTCSGKGMTEYRCVRCGYHQLEAESAEGHTPGAAATCTTPQMCVVCGAVIEHETGHRYETEITEPTCTAMGYTANICTGCGHSYRDNYTDALGHSESDWIMDKVPTTDSEGVRHTECGRCGESLKTETVEKIYNTAVTDTHGEAIVGGYLVIVTDSDTGSPVPNAAVTLGGSLSVRLPYDRLIDYADRTTITVLMSDTKAAVEGIAVDVTDRNGNYSGGETDKSGQVTVPETGGNTNGDGKTTAGYGNKDGDKNTVTVKVEDYETGRPIEGAEVDVNGAGEITVRLPDGRDLNGESRVTVTVVDDENQPKEGVGVTVRDDNGNREIGKTGDDGKLTVPAIPAEREPHKAYILGYTDGRFRPSKGMTRGEAAAIFARLLSDKTGDSTAASAAVFADVPVNAWYSGYVKYLSGYGIVTGTGNGRFSPNREITRAEFTAMAVRFFKEYGTGADDVIKEYAGFSDVESGYWAAEYIKDAAVYGWVEGYGDGTFRADDRISRAEVVTLMNRMLGREADREYVTENLRKLSTFPDVPQTHWAYYAVLEAANSHTAIFDTDEVWHR